jgi:galactose mutarotase-like enzyme
MVAKDWPYFGIWSKSGEPFVCLEPWYGIADNVDTTGKLEDKEGILKLKGGDSWSATWSVEVR